MLNQISDALSAFATCQDPMAVKDTLDALCRSAGFTGLSYLDIRADTGSAKHKVTPFFLTTARDDFISLYAEDRLYECDPVVTKARSANLPFSWMDVSAPRGRSLESIAGRRVMSIAGDFGYRNGMVIPVHGVDKLGRPTSSLTTLFWSGNPQDCAETITRLGPMIHMATLHASDRIVSLRQVVGDPDAESVEPLTPRERDCLCWTSRGKTACEIATIAAISENTVNFHLKNAMRKLGVHTKTHAVTRAINLLMINP